MSTFILKILALVFMFIDHTGEFIPHMPIYLHWIGRLSAPIFIFCSAWGFTYTKNRLAYLVRLYIASVAMSIIQCFILVDNNFFRTIFSMCIIFWLIDLYQNKDKSFKKYLLVYLSWQTVSIVVCIILLNFTRLQEEFLVCFLPALFGNVFNMEGGLVFVCLGVLIYLTKDNKKALSIAYIIFTVLYSFATMTSLIPIVLGKLYVWGFSLLSDTLEYLLDTIIRLSPMTVGGSPLFRNYQWMIIAALPFMLAFNGKRGIKAKYLFYIFYPVHIVLLFYIGKLLH